MPGRPLGAAGPVSHREAVSHRDALLRAAALALGGALLAAVPAAAQSPCANGTISQVFVDNNSVFDVGAPGLDARFNWAYRTANRLHVRTRDRVIRRELLFAEGDCFDPARLADAERHLRALPFIADADVFAVQQPDSTYHVVVETHDEWSTRLQPQVDGDQGGLGLAGVELREDNFLGRGERVGVFYGKLHDETVYGGSYGTRQLFGTNWNLDLAVARTPVGHSALQRLSLPFRGEESGWAFRQQVEMDERNFEFFVPRTDGEGLERRLFPEERRGFDVGAVRRFGARGRHTLVGLALAGESTVYPQAFLTPEEDEERQGQPGPPDPAVAGLDTIKSFRAVALVGQRNVSFARRRGVDAVNAEEDVRMGFEAELGVGRTLFGLSDDDDFTLEAGLTAAGLLGPNLFAGFRAVGEGRRAMDAPEGTHEWRNLFGQADGWAYWRPGEGSRHSLVLAASAAGGWRTTVPFQLTLGNRSGLRGYGRHAFAGERRLVGTLEHRMYWGWPFPQLLDLGSAVFVDAGKIWAGGDEFGVSSALEASPGVGLRMAFPPGSRQTFRVDVAVPVAGGDAFRDVAVSIGVGQAVGRRAVRDDPQLRRSSRRAVSASLFSFPN